MKRWVCCGKFVCHCNTEAGADNATSREVVINGRGKEIDPSRLRSGWGGQAGKKPKR